MMKTTKVSMEQAENGWILSKTQRSYDGSETVKKIFAHNLFKNAVDELIMELGGHGIWKLAEEIAADHGDEIVTRPLQAVAE